MKITVKKELTEEKELELPCFFKHVYSSIEPTYYAIFDEERAMVISANGASINCYPTPAVTQHLSSGNYAPSTESEFTTAFESTIEALTKMLPVGV